MTQAHGVSRVVCRLVPALVPALLVGGCAGAHLGSTPPRVHVRELADAYRDCVQREARPLFPRTDLTAQSVATTALNRCHGAWTAYTDEAEQTYLLHTHDPSSAHRLAMSDGYALNIHLATRIEKDVQAARRVPVGDD